MTAAENQRHTGKIETAPVPDGQAVLIVIGEGVQREKIDAVLRPLNTDPAYVSV